LIPEMNPNFIWVVYCFDVFMDLFDTVVYTWRGSCECLLLGEYADQFKKMMSESSTELSILVLQFVKINSKRGWLRVDFIFNCYNLCLNKYTWTINLLIVFDLFVLYVISKPLGTAYVESVEDITKVLLNPQFIEVEKLKIE
jgi:hypothetical protein